MNIQGIQKTNYQTTSFKGFIKITRLQGAIGENLKNCLLNTRNIEFVELELERAVINYKSAQGIFDHCYIIKRYFVPYNKNNNHDAFCKALEKAEKQGFSEFNNV